MNKRSLKAADRKMKIIEDRSQPEERRKWRLHDLSPAVTQIF